MKDALKLIAIMAFAILSMLAFILWFTWATEKAEADYWQCQQCALVVTAPTATPTAVATATKTPSTVPQLAKYEANMKSFGATNCARLKSAPALEDTYYDAEWVYYQINDYTGDASWLTCAAAAHKIYSDNYLVPNNGKLPGYWLFSHGLARSSSLSPYQLLLANGLFVNSSAYNDGYQGGSRAWYAIRENAYALMVHLRSTDFAIPINATRVNQLLGYTYLSLDQTYAVPRQAEYQKPFMTALAAQALIEYYERIGQDPGILPRVKSAADGMWTLWTGKSFKYTDSATEGMYETPDLNLLIVPVYYWIYRQTGLQVYRDRGDLIFEQGVLASVNLNQGKMFNQQYRWSAQGVKWRNG